MTAERLDLWQPLIYTPGAMSRPSLPWQLVPASLVAVVLCGLPRESHAAAATMAVVFEGDGVCPSRAVLDAALARSSIAARIVAAGSGGETARLVLRVVRTAALEVELSLGPAAPRFARTLTAPAAECEQLAQTAVLLVAAWLEDLAWNAEVAPESLPRAGSTDTAEPPPAAVEPPPAAVESPPAAVESPPAAVESPPAAVESPPAAAAAAVEPAGPPPAVEPPAEGSAGRVSRIELVPAAMLWAGAVYEPLAHRLGGHFAGMVLWSLPPWATVGLAAGFDAPMHAVIAPGKITITAQRAALVVGRTLLDVRAGDVALFVDLGVERLAASGQGYSENAAAAAYGSSGSLLLALRRVVVGELMGCLLVGGQWRFPAREIGVVGLGTTVPLAHVRPWVGVAVSWEPRRPGAD